MDRKQFAILYVDDEQHNLVAFKATFRKEYTVYTALSGKEGIEILQQHEVHLIITDQRMPEMTGVQFLEKILPQYPDSIRMILTGFSDITAIIGAINNGRVFRYITKPWDETELRMTLENARQLFELQLHNRNLLGALKQKVTELEKTLHIFQKYVPEPVVKKVLHAKDENFFEGELKNIAVLFCDIRNFTQMSETLTPSEIVAFLNAYYRIMNESIKKHNGSVNQFVGDEIFAAFGAPLSYENNELNAVFCALEMIEQLKKLNEAFEQKVGMNVTVGIGVNAGEVVTGNLGTDDKLDYSITGDTVNTGKRIETLTKCSPNAILISESVYKFAKDFVVTKEWEPMPVKGKKDKILVYEVIGKS